MKAVSSCPLGSDVHGTKAEVVWRGGLLQGSATAQSWVMDAVREGHGGAQQGCTRSCWWYFLRGPTKERYQGG